MFVKEIDCEFLFKSVIPLLPHPKQLCRALGSVRVQERTSGKEDVGEEGERWENRKGMMSGESLWMSLLQQLLVFYVVIIY